MSKTSNESGEGSYRLTWDGDLIEEGHFDGGTKQISSSFGANCVNAPI